MKDYVASVQERLRQLAVKTGFKHQLLLTRYFQERFIFRVSSSEYEDHFCLKGGTLLYALDGEKSRPTMDIDLLGLQIQNSHEHFKKIFTEICQIRYEQDGLRFLEDTLATSEIGKDRRYAGIRIGFEGRLGNIRQMMQVDIGFGDIMTPPPLRMVYPTLLEMEAPHIKAYSVETIIAEKFEAMIDLAESNSRMKDFYDVYRLLIMGNFMPDTLKEAILNTFQRRGTVYLENHPLFHADFSTNQQRIIHWKSFLKKSNLDPSIEFVEVLRQIDKFLYPIYRSYENTQSNLNKPPH
jgi:predicted nucleotidyltransferase component of viral defense system